MKSVLKLGALLLLLCTASAHAQLYKWVGPDGKINYSDTSPPSSASRVEKKSLTIGEVSAAEFPFELAEAMKNHPVTLYTSENCPPCDDARKHLNERGIPFIEKTVSTNEDIAQFRQAGGEGSLPLLLIGRSKERGFEAGAWNRALSTAGYPETSKLPKTYKSPPAQAAAPTQNTATKQDSAATNDRTTVNPSATELPPAIGNAPPGFRF